MSDLVTKKIEEAIALAELEDEPNVRIVLFALLGARESNDDGILAVLVQDIIKEVLIPRITEKKSARDN